MRKLFILLTIFFMCSSIFAKNKVLVVLSSSNYITLKDGSKHDTGFFLCELAIPAECLLEAGYQLVFANPAGKKSSIDKEGDNAKYFASKEEYHKAKKLLKHKSFLAPRKLSSLTEKELNSFAGVFLPGGHAPMEDLCKDAQMGRILAHFHKNNKPTGLICHGPIALLSAKTSSGWLYKGYKLTVFSDEEEKFAEKNILKGKMIVFPSQALKNAGANVQHAKTAWASHVVRDRELITGQNPSSDASFAQHFLKALAEKKKN